ncbi:MAG TPA: hypothetical protein VK662_04685 [Acidothermaceae bacterium]|nr:hypothetical protein [Acidothermaceae bacterium]
MSSTDAASFNARTLCVVAVGRPPPARTSLLRVVGAGSVLRVIAR